MTLYAFVSNIWTAFSSSPPFPKKRGRRPEPFSPNTLAPINHWYHGKRNRHGPRRLDDTPNSAHYPKFRIAKSVVTKRRKRCEACGTLVKEEEPKPQDGNGGGKAVRNAAPVKTVRSVKRKTPAWKAAELDEMERGQRGLKTRLELDMEEEMALKEQAERMMEEGVAMRRTLRGRVVEY
jgi:hypothetical protein